MALNMAASVFPRLPSQISGQGHYDKSCGVLNHVHFLAGKPFSDTYFVQEPELR